MEDDDECARGGRPEGLGSEERCVSSRTGQTHRTYTERPEELGPGEERVNSRTGQEHKTYSREPIGSGAGNENILNLEGNGHSSRQRSVHSSSSAHLDEKRGKNARYAMKRPSRSRTRELFYSTSTESRKDTPPPRKSTRSNFRTNDFNSKLMDKFLLILEKVKNADKPKMTFNTNVIPEFDPLIKHQSVLTWISKVEECAEIYGWEEKEVIHYALPKLVGVAKTWYQGLTSILHTWTEWKRKLIESFPCREDYAELLTEMLEKRASYGDSLETYYYTKMNLLNRCKIYGRQAVDCLLYGIEDRTVKIGAQAVQFSEPEQVLTYFRTVKVDQGKEGPNVTQKLNERKFGPNSDYTALLKPGTRLTNSDIRCYNCHKIGHPSFKCNKPLLRCEYCDLLGHEASNCPRNRTANETEKNDVSGNDLKSK